MKVLSEKRACRKTVHFSCVVLRNEVKLSEKAHYILFQSHQRPVSKATGL